MSGVVYTEPLGTGKTECFEGSVANGATATLAILMNDPCEVQIHNKHASGNLTFNILTPWTQSFSIMPKEFLTLGNRFQTANLTNTSGATITYRVIVTGF